MQIRRSIISKKDLRKDIKKQEQILPDQSEKFRKVFEICGDEIISYLNKKEQMQLRSVCRISFYMVQTYQVWNMMIFDSDQISQATTNDSNMKESFLKNSFYSKVGKSRPSTQEQMQKEQWLIKPANYNPPQKKLVFLKNKNKIEDNILSDEDLKQTITVWTLNLNSLEKQINIAKIQTDSFIQEITLWIDHVNLLQEFQNEYQLEHVGKILQLLKQKSILDVSLDRKRKILQDILNSLLNDFELKKKYSNDIQILKPICQRLLQIKLADFQSEIPNQLWPKIDQIQNQFDKIFNIRKEFFFMKLFQITQKIFSINLGWIVDFSNYELTLNLLEQFQQFLIQLIQRHSFGEKKFNQNQLHHSQNELFFQTYKKSIDDIIKMLKLNKKLYDGQKENLQVQAMLQSYKQQTFDQFQEKQQWAQIYVRNDIDYQNTWKEKYQNIKKQTQEVPESQEGISFGFFQTKMSWSIQ
ncbi:unnamed protein product (macronuclear) [Paramecium tetraurelia]|uniref:Dynein heavy chain tail domain-containing protein n=1 Tax=Paramecium tetraurelia TaxID=5888 RepID=A0BW41_PARTE|nr:uncharacterized protein GSPATT00032610001 [Paramecium tetraurelia]CAK62758.1 unnamed protein product [Paramecium tetraurelia]|eukprot:XP_001430156.1 hypothetical protein (macronuclear) [Paramecium tetraurelia strain d4-2]